MGDYIFADSHHVTELPSKDLSKLDEQQCLGFGMFLSKRRSYLDDFVRSLYLYLLQLLHQGWADLPFPRILIRLDE